MFLQLVKFEDKLIINLGFPLGNCIFYHQMQFSINHLKKFKKKKFTGRKYTLQLLNIEATWSNGDQNRQAIKTNRCFKRLNKRWPTLKTLNLPFARLIRYHHKFHLASQYGVNFLQAIGHLRSIIALGRSELSGKEEFYLIVQHYTYSGYNSLWSKNASML